MHTENKLPELSQLIRAWLIQMTTTAGSGHLTSALSATDVMVGLMFGGVFQADVKRFSYPNNDRLIFSKGHAAPLLYALYAAAGRVPRRELMTLRTFSSRLEGHPTTRFPMTEVPTGSLGQGLSIALGEAIALQTDRLTARVYCLLGDSELAEGSVWEAIQLAGHRHQSNLVAIVDVNGLGQSGPTMYGHNALQIAKRAQAFGWRTAVIDGHNFHDIHHAFTHALTVKDQPFMVVARTIKGKGVTSIEGKHGWHGRALSAADARTALHALGPVDAKLRGAITQPAKRKPIVPARTVVPDCRYKIGTSISPRLAIGQSLVRLAKRYPQMIVLDGEVKNSTHTDRFEKKAPRRFIEGYIAEQNMAGMSTGLARRGKLPVVATFGAFLTRAYDQLRMASYARTHEVYIGTHAGVHIGEDGGSQMALQDISLFRSLELSVVLYPSDAMSAERLLERAIRADHLVYLRVTRGDLPVIYSPTTRFKIGGSHILRQSKNDRLTIVAAGVTVHEALKAADRLGKKGIYVRVIDLYSIKPIDVVTLKAAVKDTRHLLVVEDHYPEGGVAEAVRTALRKDSGCVTSLAVRKTPRSGTPTELLSYEGIDADAIISASKMILK